MPRTLVVSGVYMSTWPGVRVVQFNNGQFHDITDQWSWSQEPHQHYEVNALQNGSYWVPVSTNPPRAWYGATPVVGTQPAGNQPVNPNGTEYRPTATYIWIPNASIPPQLVPGRTSNSVVCHPPNNYPPVVLPEHVVMLNEIKGDKPANTFSDSDGLISFVNMSSSLVTNNPQFTTGRNVCDKVCNFFATMRLDVFSYLQKNPGKRLPGDDIPKTQWDYAVTHLMQQLLVKAGGFSAFKVTSETYSSTQVIAEFNTSFVKLIFDAVAVPENIIDDVTKFIQGIGSTLRLSWDDRSRNFSTCLMGQCHEAVPIDAAGNTYVYFPKLKYYYISVDSSQQEFTSPCTKVQHITFNFKYDSYVTALKASVLDPATDDYKNFVAFLDKQQSISYKDADNTLDAILDGATSASPQVAELQANAFGVELSEYPRIAVTPTHLIQQVLNHEILA
jgi:hypothetical protein